MVVSWNHKRWLWLPGLVLVLAGPAARGAQPACQGWIAVEARSAGSARILLDGKASGRETPATLKDVPCGEHAVEIRKPFHRGEQRTVWVHSQEVVKLKLALTPEYGSLDVVSTPPGARITLGGKELGQAPLRVPRVRVGKHELAAALPDYRLLTQEIEIRQLEQTRLELSLRPAFGQIRVTTRPERGGMVLLDGDPVGTTPLTLKRILSGDHVIEVSKDHYKRFVKAIQLGDGQQSVLVASLEPDYGVLRIFSSPAGSRVRVDGKVRGQTPVTLKLAPGTRSVRIEGPDGLYHAVEKQVRVQLLKKHRLQVELPVRTGSLLVDTVPYAAEILLDGAPSGTAPLSLRSLPVGRHTLAARLDGKASQSTEIRIQEHQVFVAEINLDDPGRSAFTSRPAGPSAAEEIAAILPVPLVPEDPPPAVKRVDDRPRAPANEPGRKPGAPRAEAPGPATGPESREAPGPAPRAQAPRRVPGPPPHETHAPAPGPILAEARGPAAAPGLGPTEATRQLDPPLSAERRWAWITSGTAVACGLGSVFLFVLGANSQAEADDVFAQYKVTPHGPQRDLLEERFNTLDDRAFAQTVGGWVFLGAALAAGGTAVYLFLTDPGAPGASASRTALAAQPLPGGGFVGIAGTF